MNVFQSGIPKSGNSWIYNVVHHALVEGGHEVKNYITTQPIHELAQSWPEPIPGQASTDTIHFRGSKIDYGIGRIFRYPITDWQDYLSKATQIWSHEPYRPLMKDKLKDVSNIVYIVRDPRDASISHSHFVFANHMKWLNINATPNPDAFMEKRFFYLVRRWAEHVGSWLLAAQDPGLNIHFVFYERLLHDFDNELERLQQFLKLNLSAKQKATVKEETTFKSMKEKYPRHLRKGTDLQWVNTLTPLQKSESVAMVREMLKLLHYPLTEPTSGEYPLPCVSQDVTKRDIHRAIRHAQQLTWREVAARIKRQALKVVPH